MSYWISLCVAIQSAVFFVFLILQKNKENSPIIGFFGLKFVIYSLFFFLTNLNRFSEYYELIYNIYLFVSYLNPVFVLYLIYFLIQKPINVRVKLFWTLPFLGVAYRLFLLYKYPSILTIDYYHSWYFDFSFYYRLLFFVVLIIEMKGLNKQYQSLNFGKNNLKFISFLWGKWFLIFQIIKFGATTSYLFLTLANGRLFTVDNNYLTYSENNYNIVQDFVLAYFLSIFGYLGFKYAKVFKEAKKNNLSIPSNEA